MLIIYQTILDLAYALFIIGITISLAVDQKTRDSFTTYLGKQSSIIFIVIMIILAVLSYSLSKAYSPDKNYQPNTKKKVNFVEDVVKGTIFLLMIIFITGFVNENKSQIKLQIAYWIYMISMILFKILHVIKWYYYCLGSGKDDTRPWAKGYIEMNDE